MNKTKLESKENKTKEIKKGQNEVWTERKGLVNFIYIFNLKF